MEQILRTVGPKLSRRELDIFLDQIITLDQAQKDCQENIFTKDETISELENRIANLESTIRRREGEIDEFKKRSSRSRSVHDQTQTIAQAGESNSSFMSNSLVTDLQYALRVLSSAQQFRQEETFMLRQRIESQSTAEITFTLGQLERVASLVSMISPESSERRDSFVTQNKLHQWIKENTKATATAHKHYSQMLAGVSTQVTGIDNHLKSLKREIDGKLFYHGAWYEVVGKFEPAVIPLRISIRYLVEFVLNISPSETSQPLRQSQVQQVEICVNTLSSLMSKLSAQRANILDRYEQLMSVSRMDEMSSGSKNDDLLEKHDECVQMLHAEVQEFISLSDQGLEQSMHEKCESLAHNVSVCLSFVASTLRELNHTFADCKDEMKTANTMDPVRSLYVKQQEVIKNVQEFITILSEDYAKFSGEYCLLKQKVLLYEDVIRHLTHAKLDISDDMESIGLIPNEDDRFHIRGIYNLIEKALKFLPASNINRSDLIQLIAKDVCTDDKPRRGSRDASLIMQDADAKQIEMQIGQRLDECLSIPANYTDGSFKFITKGVQTAIAVEFDENEQTTGFARPSIVICDDKDSDTLVLRRGDRLATVAQLLAAGTDLSMWNRIKIKLGDLPEMVTRDEVMQIIDCETPESVDYENMASLERKGSRISQATQTIRKHRSTQTVNPHADASYSTDDLDNPMKQNTNEVSTSTSIPELDSYKHKLHKLTLAHQKEVDRLLTAHDNMKTNYDKLMEHVKSGHMTTEDVAMKRSLHDALDQADVAYQVLTSGLGKLAHDNAPINRTAQEHGKPTVESVTRLLEKNIRSLSLTSTAPETLHTLSLQLELILNSIKRQIDLKKSSDESTFTQPRLHGAAGDDLITIMARQSFLR